MTYESSKQLLTTYTGESSTTNPLSVVVAGGLCGVVSWSLIYPIDSAKSIYQRNSLAQCKTEPLKKRPKIQFFNRRMYRGLGVSMSRSCVVNAIFFSSFEFIKKHINDLEDWSGECTDHGCISRCLTLGLDCSRRMICVYPVDTKHSQILVQVSNCLTLHSDMFLSSKYLFLDSVQPRQLASLVTSIFRPQHLRLALTLDFSIYITT